MTKTLGGNVEEHIASFINKLELHFPNIREWTILWFDKFEGNYFLKKEYLKELNSLPKKLNELSSKGKSWVNLYGEGKIDESVYLISIEYNPELGDSTATSINASGPFLNSDGSAKLKANIDII